MNVPIDISKSIVNSNSKIQNMKKPESKMNKRTSSKWVNNRVCN